LVHAENRGRDAAVHLSTGLGELHVRRLPLAGWALQPPAMAKVYFYYSAMNAGKSTVLLQASHNYHERGMRTLRFIPAIDTRAGVGRIQSRIGISAEAITLTTDDDLLARVQVEHVSSPVACALVDEAQFLTRAQVWQAGAIADRLAIPVLCYGLRTDFQGNLFEGSAALLAIADELIELKTVCHCGRKATMNVRLGPDGQPVREGQQIQIGGNERYVAMCRRHFREALGR
jgi:thymidine kinase